MSIDLVIDAIDALIDDVNCDERWRSWFSDVDKCARKVLYALHLKTFDSKFDLPGPVGGRIRLGRRLKQRFYANLGENPTTESIPQYSQSDGRRSGKKPVN